MRSAPFHFKHFSIAQEGSAHKVGTDGVLLGAWVNVTITDTRMLDIGTGTGLIALMLAQRSTAQAQIDALDIGEKEVKEARQNITRSPWPQKITVYEGAVQNFNPGHLYDLVVSNPPYYVNSLVPPHQGRSVSRHTHQLPFGALLARAGQLLSPKGRFATILPYATGLHFLKMSSAQGLYAVRKTTFRARTHKPPERLLMELSRSPGPIAEENEIILYSAGNDWSEEYRHLTRDFYLKC